MATESHANVIANPSGSGLIFVHRCGLAPWELDRAVLDLRAGVPASNMVMVPPGACMTSTAEAFIRVILLSAATGDFIPASGADRATSTRFLRSEDRSLGGYAVSLETMWPLTQAWYEDRLDPQFTPKTLDHHRRLLADAGLTGEFWSLG